MILRRATEADLPAIAGILGGPGVVAWWGEFDEEAFASELDDPGSHPMLIEHEGEVVGFIQYYEETDPMYRHANIDIALHDDQQGRGYALDALRALIRYLVEVVGHHRITIDPAASNERAIRCYERAGFRPVGILRQYERGLDGTFHDGLLMDLLARDLA